MTVDDGRLPFKHVSPQDGEDVQNIKTEPDDTLEETQSLLFDDGKGIKFFGDSSHPFIID